MKRISMFEKTLVMAGCFALINAINAGVSHAASVANDASGKGISPISLVRGDAHAFCSFPEEPGGVAMLLSTGSALAPSANSHVVTGTTRSVQPSGEIAVARAGEISRATKEALTARFDSN